MQRLNTFAIASRLSSIYSGRTSVVFVGNPGVGKSTLHNALGGTFDNGFALVQGMAVGEPQDVTCNGRPLRLVDVPGICDNSGGDGAEGDDVMDHNLRTLRNRLNDGHAYVIFFVVTPRNGRIDNSDLALMRLFLEKFERGPLVGLILTQIRKRDMTSVDNPTFVEGVMKVLSHGGANLRSLSTHRALVLKDHEEEFSDAEIQNIREYILSFEPTQVRIHNMVSGAWRTLLQFFKRLVS